MKYEDEGSEDLDLEALMSLVKDMRKKSGDDLASSLKSDDEEEEDECPCGDPECSGCEDTPGKPKGSLTMIVSQEGKGKRKNSDSDYD
jgi:hypothetical protein